MVRAEQNRRKNGLIRWRDAEEPGPVPRCEEEDQITKIQGF